MSRIRRHVRVRWGGVRRHVRTCWREIVFTVAALLPPVLFDVWLLASGLVSISVRTWNFVDAHPLAALAGFAVDLIPMYLVRRSWPCVVAWAGVAFHLFTFVGAR